MPPFLWSHSLPCESNLLIIWEKGHRMDRPEISGSHPANAALVPIDPHSHLNQARGHVQIPYHWPSVRVLADVTGCDATPAHAYKLQTTTDVMLGRTIIYCLRPRYLLPACIYPGRIHGNDKSASSVWLINQTYNTAAGAPSNANIVSWPGARPLSISGLVYRVYVRDYTDFHCSIEPTSEKPQQVGP